MQTGCLEEDGRVRNLHAVKVDAKDVDPQLHRHETRLVLPGPVRNRRSVDSALGGQDLVK